MSIIFAPICTLVQLIHTQKDAQSVSDSHNAFVATLSFKTCEVNK